MKPLAVPLDAEHVVIDYLTTALAARLQDRFADVFTDIFGGANLGLPNVTIGQVTVGVNVPTTWTAATTPHVQVALDGTPDVIYPIMARATVRLTAWASNTTAAKALAALTQGLMLSHPGSPGVGSVRSLTGVLPTRDPVTGAQLATVTVRVNLRYSVLT